METFKSIDINGNLSVEFVLKPCEYKLINLDLTTEFPNEYPNEFNEFCSKLKNQRLF
jgi:hypothetical protein